MRWTTPLLLCLLTVTGYSQATPLSVQPVPRTQQFEWMSLSTWYEKHARDVAVAEAGKARVVFLGDSITDGWDRRVWDKHFATLGAANFGIGGDLTQNLLWRLDHGAVEKLDPAVVVVLIGVNNFLHNDASASATYAGIKAVVERTLTAYPNARVLLQGIFPYGEKPGTPNRQRVQATNKKVRQLASLPRVDYHDFGDRLTNSEGRIKPAIMGDYLHPTARGYKLWADALAPIVEKALQEKE